MVPELIEVEKMIEGLTKIKIPAEVIKTASQMVFQRSISKGQIIVYIGNVQEEVYFVASGVLRSYYIDINGNEVTRFFAQEGSLCCSEALFNNEPSKCCIEALDDCKVMAIKGSDLKKLIETNMYATKAYIKALEYSLKYKIERESSFLLKGAAERYLDFKRMYPRLEERVNQAYIASYLGITPVSLSRIRRSIK